MITSLKVALDSRFPRQLVLINLVIAILIALLVIWGTHRAEKLHQDIEQLRVENVVQLLEKSIKTTLDKADMVLGSVAYLYEQQLTSNSDDTSLRNLVQGRETLFPDLFQLYIVKPDGHLWSADQTNEQVDLSDREYFHLAQTQGDKTTRINGPIQGRVSGRWVILLTKRLEHPDRRFAGVAVVVIEASKFAPLLSTPDLGKNGAISLRNDRLELVARYPEGPGNIVIGQKTISAELATAIEQNPSHGNYLATTRMDGVERLNAYRKISDAPFYIIAGIATENWKGTDLRDDRAYLLFGAVTFGLMLFWSSLLYRNWKRREEAVANQFALEREVSLANERLRKISERLPGMVYQYHLRPDGTSCFPYASSAIADIFHVRLDDVVADAEPILIQVHPDDAAEMFDSIRDSAHELTPWQHEFRITSSDSCARWLLGNAVPERHSDGGTVWYGFVTDVTERKAVEAELKQYRTHLEQMVELRTADLETAKEAAEAASRAKSTFLSMISHELRTPMNGVMGMISLALSKTRDAVVTDYLHKADRASKQLLSIINNILDISQIEANRLSLASISFNVDEIVERLHDILDNQADAKNLQFYCTVDERTRGASYIGDPTRLMQILLNLAGNAIKFTPGGSVSLSIQEIPGDGATCRLRFDIQDTGIGIAAGDQVRIFEAFEQVDNSYARQFGGTGLGLALSKRLVEAMQGMIGLNSAPNAGTNFWFEIPIERGRLAASPEAPDFSGESLLAEHRGATVLIAEDEPINQEILQNLLEDAGLTVFVATDGEEAVNFAKCGRFDLVLMDMKMPGMGGLEATEEIRKIPAYATTPIIAVTANAFSEDRDQCIRAGMNDHLGKPIVPAEIYRVLKKWLDNAKQVGSKAKST